MTEPALQRGSHPIAANRVRLDADGRVTDVGARAAAALGMAHDALVGQAFADLFFARDQGAAAELATSKTGELAVLLPEARSAEHGAVAAEAHEDADGRYVVVLNVGDLFRRAFDGDQLFQVSIDLVCVAATDGYFLRVSPSFSTTLGWSEEELLTRPFLSFVHPDDIESTLERMEDLASGNRTLGFENRYRTKAGGWRVLQWASYADEETGYIYAIARDVTHERAVRAQLRRARDMAESASRAKGSFIANMSHELRTPLNAIIGYSEMLLEDAEDPTTRDDLRRINDAGNQLLELINGVLDLSKMEAGQIEIFIEPVSVPELVEQVAATVRPQIERNGNRLEVAAGEGDVVQTDRRKLQQILLNLLSNAAKFTREGEVGLAVESADEEVVFVVRDNGIGIGPDELRTVFEPFDQGAADTGRRYGGTGLGLAIANRFAGLVGARLEAESELGVGSTFRLCVPYRHERFRAAVDVTGGYIALVDS